MAVEILYRASGPIDIRASVVERYSDLRRQLEQLSSITDECKALERQIIGWYADAEPAEEFLLCARLVQVRVSPRELRRKISQMKKVYWLLGKEVFLLHCSFPLRALDVLIPESQVRTLLEEGRTGPRELKLIQGPGCEDFAA